MWSLTTPTFCLKAYTLVGPTKRYACDLSCFENASASGVDAGGSASERGACFRRTRRGERLEQRGLVVRASAPLHPTPPTVPILTRPPLTSIEDGKLSSCRLVQLA